MVDDPDEVEGLDELERRDMGEVLGLKDRSDLTEETRSALLAAESSSDLAAAEDRADVLRDLLGWHDALVDRLAKLRDGDEMQREDVAIALRALVNGMGRAQAALEGEARWVDTLRRGTI
jgi:hypothetical protein